MDGWMDGRISLTCSIQHTNKIKKIVTSSSERVGIIQVAKANLVDDPNRIQLHT